MKKKRLSYDKAKSLYGYMFIGLWLVGFIFLFLFPFVQAVVYSFNDVAIEPGSLNLKFIGWENYLRAFKQDPEFLPAFWSSLSSSVLQMPVTIIFSIFVAVLLNHNFHGRGIARAVFFLPVIIMSGPVIGVMNYDAFFNSLMSGERASAMLTLTGTKEILQTLGVNTMIADYIVDITNSLFNLSWSSGIQILIFIAGLQSIPATYYEVAQMEGATGWEVFWKVTMPAIGPMILVNVVYTMYDTLLTQGAMFEKIQNLIANADFSYAAALSILCFVVWGALIAVIYQIISRWVAVK